MWKHIPNSLQKQALDKGRRGRTQDEPRNPSFGYSFFGWRDKWRGTAGDRKVGTTKRTNGSWWPRMKHGWNTERNPCLICVQSVARSLASRSSSLPPTHYPLPTAHCSLLTAHCSLLTAHCSLLTAHCSLLTAHCSLLTAHCSLLTAHCSLLTAHCSLLTAHCSLLTAHCSLLTCCKHLSLYIIRMPRYAKIEEIFSEVPQVIAWHGLKEFWGQL